VSAWIRPRQFSIQSNQNQRRLFEYGAYPKGSANVDILSTGIPTLYQCYQRAEKASTSISKRTFLAIDRNSPSPGSPFVPQDLPTSPSEGRGLGLLDLL